MSEKPFASLEPTLLARKGAAKPAMRPQVAAAPVFAAQAGHSEDLGWNDMGEDAHETGAEVLPLAAANGKHPVRRQIEAIEAHLARAAGEAKDAPPRKPATADGRRAAFTLRLDQQRHLKLRLACTISNRSAQQVVTEALDRLLAAMPELDSLAAQVKQR